MKCKCKRWYVFEQDWFRALGNRYGQVVRITDNACNFLIVRLTDNSQVTASDQCIIRAIRPKEYKKIRKILRKAKKIT